ncbi:MarR family winged helix-turn-helix transcriptional regulator [Sneathiella aquimaris]|uniref:MarR family winged helix-turn-helix transcriptional regulator n=1 Tax=Sneathiella aquimaris TaxID=2599305 RepID=UPI00146C040F|nr:MarR family transcriptional regulator [Sneathiella aquimaris]
MSVKSEAENISHQCFAVRLRKLNRMVSRLYDDSFRPYGITIAQFNLLVAVATERVTSPSQMVQVLSLEKSTVSRNIEKMIQKGWLKRTPCTDKRSHLLMLTKAGSQLLSDVTPAWRKAQKEANEALGNMSAILTNVPLL